MSKYYPLIVERRFARHKLYWRERKLLVKPPMPDRSKRRGQTKCSLWSSGLGVGCLANDSTPEKFTVTKPAETNEGGPWRRPRPTEGCKPVQEKNEVKSK
jgi:hypothetical protein